MSEWQTIESAPKSEKPGEGIYLLGYLPELASVDEYVHDRKALISVIWWEPKFECWWCDNDIECKPSHWMHLPEPPTEKE